MNCGEYVACRSGHIDIVKLLLNYGANEINIALEIARRYEHVEIVELLISRRQ